MTDLNIFLMYFLEKHKPQGHDSPNVEEQGAFFALMAPKKKEEEIYQL